MLSFQLVLDIVSEGSELETLVSALLVNLLVQFILFIVQGL